MKRILAALAGLLGLAWLRSRGRQPAIPPASPAADPATDPATELRAKLAEARAADDRDAFESGETPVDAAPDAPGVEERRRDVHERARARIDELRGD